MESSKRTNYFKRQDQRWYQQMTSGTRIAGNVPIGTWVFIDMYPKSKPPKAKLRFHGPFIIVKKLDQGAVIVRLQNGSEEIVNLDRCHTFKGQPLSGLKILSEVRKKIWVNPLL